jgi:transposase-like protein
MNLLEVFEQFPTENDARDFIRAVRWPNGVSCPKCKCQKISELKSRRQFTCLGCRYRFSVTSDTVLHSTKLPLRKWLLAIYLLSDAKKSVSSHQLSRELKISIKRAWHLTHRIRTAMAEDHAQAELFWGVVQIDDYYVGGAPRPEEKGKYKRGTGSEKQQPVVGVVSEAGKVRTAMVPNTRGLTIYKTVSKWLDTESTQLHSDQHMGYLRLGRYCFKHRVVNHTETYVAEDGTHTNAVENAWSLLARAIMGSFHHISRKHLPKYLAEFDSRFNARAVDSDVYFERIVGQADGRRLSMRQLTGKDDGQSAA